MMNFMLESIQTQKKKLKYLHLIQLMSHHWPIINWLPLPKLMPIQRFHWTLWSNHHWLQWSRQVSVSHYTLVLVFYSLSVTLHDLISIFSSFEPKILPYHLTIELLQLVCLFRSTFNGLQGTFHSVQPVLAVRLLEHNLTEKDKY